MAVTVSSNEGLQVEVVAGPHGLTVDEPESLGGSNGGPNPFDVFLASIGACTAVAILDSANERELSVDRVTVKVKHKQNKIAKRPSDSELLMLSVARTINIEGPLTDEERAWLFQQGEDCPISRSIKAGLVIDARLEPAGSASRL